ncbi:MAG: hypothetical protein OQK55_09005, partial [Thermoanaerobaculales bacterium]|nr:hypothetical protein [Thermoanaerobaculales bacterium]
PGWERSAERAGCSPPPQTLRAAVLLQLTSSALELRARETSSLLTWVASSFAAARLPRLTPLDLSIANAALSHTPIQSTHDSDSS